MNLSPTIFRAFCLAAAVMPLASCQKKQALKAQVIEAREKLEESRKMMAALDDQLRVVENSAQALERSASGGFREKLEAAEKQLKEVTADSAVLNSRIRTLEERNKSVTDELREYENKFQRK
ncbi:MAG: hypothetical protein K1X78_05635 [Verrucomicrobiaceae bacterium]|nr:hypothetical protein [Verrucomicrobiaceae bacterium]